MRGFSPLHLLLAVALALAPVLPGIAFADRADTDHAAHADAGDGHAHHDSHASRSTDETSPCAQHDGCHGQCCATCVQCFTGSTSLADGTADARPVQTPTVRTLLDSLYVSLLNRPPSAV